MKASPGSAPDAARRWRLAAVCAVAAALGVLGKHWTGWGSSVAIGQGEDFFGTIFLILAPRIVLLRLPLWKIAVPVLCIVVTIEISQLSRAAWLEALRGHWLARRIVGNTFEWADLAAYALAFAAALAIDRRLSRGA